MPDFEIKSKVLSHMYTVYLEAAAASLIICTLVTAGGLWMAVKHPDWLHANTFNHLIALGTGILFAVAFHDFLPLALANHSEWTPILIFLGVLLMILSETYLAPRLNFLEGERCDHDHALDHDHKKELDLEHEHHLVSHKAACSAVGCLLICVFFDGMKLMSAFFINSQTGWITSLGLLAHVLPDGFLAAAIAISGGMSKKSTRQVSYFTGIALLSGVALTVIMQKLVDFQHMILPVTCGVLLYVIFAHLLPVTLKKTNGIFWLASGPLFFFLIHIFI